VSEILWWQGLSFTDEELDLLYVKDNPVERVKHG